jgi:DNA repair exonuclease SbcCD ATPase subunit
MSEVLDFGSSYGEAHSTLSTLTSQTRDQQGTVDEQNSTLEQGHQTLDAAKAQAEQLLAALGSGIESGSQEAEAASGEFTSAADALEAATDSASGSMTSLQEAITETYDEVSEEVAQTLEEANQLYSDVTVAIETAVEATGETMGQVEQAAALTTQTLGELESSVTELTGRMTSLGQDTIGKASDLASKITDDVTSRAENLFGDVTQSLGSDFFNQAVSGFEGLTDNMGNLYENFESVVNGLGDNVMNRLGEVFTNTIQHAQDQAAAKIEEEINNIINDAVAFVTEEIASNLIMATAGSATTAALGPALPVIVALKALVGAIKTALEILRMGF